MNCVQQAGTRKISLSAHMVSWDSILLHEQKYMKQSSTSHNHTDTGQQHRDTCELVDQGVVLSKSTQKWALYLQAQYSPSCSLVQYCMVVCTTTTWTLITTVVDNTEN